ncbi:MAG: D-alanyl-D-alanine carboxypeptidase family protein [Atopobium sp.]|uniref:D-alanyl-D-alanine carboxypeptidase family protein n=1 Tax=Atopobium sp. TaxID=1872650 RepID=UPI002A74CC80|nr:D-alanyl-D-alanine carboxypeptidase family protein [Atopobium sp.]MDY2788229.1 D-alanyl-D-alanine carboxypeptidase family protein [Atopobium sp.]MDY4522591.1 D-alanyl-D-alanine carboxypeptidase family protein [Atopobium sp.]
MLKAKYCIALLVVLVIGISIRLVLFTSAFAEETATNIASDEPQLSEAQAAIVTDSTGQTLWSKNEDTQMSLASVTKVMTAMVALDSDVDLNATYTMTGVDLGPNSQTAGYKQNDQAMLSDLLDVMLVFSANDAATEIARIVAGHEDAFVERMNKKALELGMTHTHFTNVHGLEDAGNHYSSVHDMVLMGRHALRYYPLIADIVTKRSVTVPIGDKNRTFKSTDQLMDTYQGLLGIKTGSVESGTTFLGAAQRGEVRLYSAVLGCQTNEGRFADSAALLDWGFAHMSEKTMAEQDMVVRWAPFAYNFSFKCPIYASAAMGIVFDGAALNYSSLQYRPNTLVSSQDAYGVTRWYQGERTVAICSYHAGTPLLGVPSYDIFTTPHFYSV